MSTARNTVNKSIFKNKIEPFSVQSIQELVLGIKIVTTDARKLRFQFPLNLTSKHSERAISTLPYVALETVPMWMRAGMDEGWNSSVGSVLGSLSCVMQHRGYNPQSLWYREVFPWS